MDESTRIVVLGKTGVGKSSLANTIFGEKVFMAQNAAISITSECKAETKSVNGQRITWIDTPGFFDTGRSEEEMKPEIVKCITECAPGPHAILIVLKVERYTEHEQAVIKKIVDYFSEEAFKYAIVLFTYGDELPDGMKIEAFADQSKDLKDLIKKCGDRCHVVDNKRWQKAQHGEYRNNQFQVEELLKTIDRMTEANKGVCYTNEMLEGVKKEIQEEEKHIRQSSAHMSPEEITQKAKTIVFAKQLSKASGVRTGVLLGSLLGRAMKIMNEEGSTVALVLGVAAQATTPSGVAFVTGPVLTAEEQLE